MSLPYLSEILKDTSEKEGRKEKINFLKTHYPNKALQALLKYAFDDNIKWLLPEGSPPFKEFKDAPDNGGLYENIRKLYLFVDGGNPNLKQNRREQLFVDFLETIDPDEARLVIAAKDNKIHELYKGVTKHVVSKAFPGLL